jgi:hypothetical protein
MGERHLLAAVCIIAATFVGVLTLISDGGSTPSAAVDQPSTPSETNSTQPEDETLLGEDNPLTAKIAPWQVGASYDVVLARFDKAASGGTRCDSLVALTSLPDLKLLATLSRSELAEYFVRWGATADQVEPQLSGQLLKELGGARGTIEAVQERVDTSGGTIRSSAFVQFLSDNQNLLDDLLRFYGSVAQECPAPTP